MRHATLEVGQVIPYLIYNLRQTINNTVITSDTQLKLCTSTTSNERGRGGAQGGEERAPCWWWGGTRGAVAGWPRSSGPTGRPGVQPPTVPRRRRPHTGRRHARRGGAARSRRKGCPEPRCGRDARRRRRIWPEPTRTLLPAWFDTLTARRQWLGYLGEFQRALRTERAPIYGGSAAPAAVWCVCVWHSGSF